MRYCYTESYSGTNPTSLGFRLATVGKMLALDAHGGAAVHKLSHERSPDVEDAADVCNQSGDWTNEDYPIEVRIC